MSIHSEHPFAGGQRELGKAFRGRLGARVGLLTSGAAANGWAGLTVSSLLVVGGDPWRLVVPLDPLAEVTSVVEQTGCGVVQLLGARHRHLADVFAGLAPAPGGVFRVGSWRQGEWGPLLEGELAVDSWAGLRLESAVDLGWSRLCTFTLTEAQLGDDPEPLHHRRGRYLVLGP